MCDYDNSRTDCDECIMAHLEDGDCCCLVEVHSNLEDENAPECPEMRTNTNCDLSGSLIPIMIYPLSGELN